MDKVRFGIIGLGSEGKKHAQRLLNAEVKDAVLSAVYDIEPSCLQWLKDEDEVRIFSSTAEMLKSGEVDALLVATPHYLHPPIALEAFSRGLHVMIEKPAGVYTKQVREMNEALTDSGLTFGIMYPHRLDKSLKRIHKKVSSGKLGEIRRTNWYYSAPYNAEGWRSTWKGSGGGILLNTGIYVLDIWQWVCGMPSKVTAFCHMGKHQNIQVEDDVTAYAEYPNGATGVFVAGTDPVAANRFEIIGESGKLVYDKVLSSDSSGCKDVLDAFVSKIIGKKAEYPQGEEGINGLMLANAMLLSTWLGKTIPLPLDEELFLSELQKKYV